MTVPKAEVYDVLIIGAGVTGVAIAWTLARRKPRLKLAVLEKEDGVARHTSGRNSGVVHAGFNPKPGSLKARFCMEGNRLIHEVCASMGVPLRNVGTLVVARTQGEGAILEELYRRGEANGVPELQLLGKKELVSREPHVRGGAALFAPTGSVIDSRRFVEALAEEARGVCFRFEQRVRSIEERSSFYRILTDRGEFQSQYLINAAGLYADLIAHMLGVGTEYTILPFRGEYYYVRKSHLVKAMVYPVPDLRYPFLGIHFTPTAYGELKVGPNAVLALGRESYRNLQIHLGETLSMAWDRRIWKLWNSDFLRMASQHLWTSLSKRAFLKEANQLVEGLEMKDLIKGPPPGNRAQLVDAHGQLIDDLVVERQETAIHILNVVSPGFTCALPFAEYVVSLL